MQIKLYRHFNCSLAFHNLCFAPTLPCSNCSFSHTRPQRARTLPTHHIDVGVDEPKLLHVCHFLLQEQIHLLLVLLQVLFLRLQSLKLNLETGLDLLHLYSLVPAVSGGTKRRQTNSRCQVVHRRYKHRQTEKWFLIWIKVGKKQRPKTAISVFHVMLWTGATPMRELTLGTDSKRNEQSLQRWITALIE